MAHEVSFVAGADLFTRNLHFVGSYWDEHRINVRDLFSKVISVDNLVRICENAARLCLTFNEQTKWIPTDYNRNSLLTGLRALLYHTCCTSIKIAQ
jgi:hypothetical protein